MKLLKCLVCLWTRHGGNVKTKTVMGDTTRNRFSDGGSIPPRSIAKDRVVETLSFCYEYRESNRKAEDGVREEAPVARPSCSAA